MCFVCLLVLCISCVLCMCVIVCVCVCVGAGVCIRASRMWDTLMIGVLFAMLDSFTLRHNL